MKKDISKEETFETALKKLEVITRELENGEVDLESSIKKYEEANMLLQYCSDKLNSAHETVNKILNEKGELEDFKTEE